MKKPVWIRLTGYLALAALAAAGAFFYTYSHGYPTQAVALLMALSGAAGAFTSLAWCALSLIHWGLRRQAAMGAEAMRAAMAGALAPSKSLFKNAAPLTPPAWDQKAAVSMCRECRLPAVLHCCRHESDLCWQHVVQHDSDECTYIRAERVLRPRAETPERRRTVATSPLSGAR